jgi:hypothetical protein
MALTILGSSTWNNAQRGVQSNEVGISIRRWAVRFHPEINEKLPDNAGQTVARAVANQPSREITLEGEVTTVSNTGVMGIAFAAFSGYTFANDASWGTGVNAGGIILDEVTETQERAGWRSINMRLSSDPLCVP